MYPHHLRTDHSFGRLQLQVAVRMAGRAELFRDFPKNLENLHDSLISVCGGVRTPLLVVIVLDEVMFSGVVLVESDGLVWV